MRWEMGQKMEMKGSRTRKKNKIQKIQIAFGLQIFLQKKFLSQ